jgi:hypothetical protein
VATLANNWDSLRRGEATFADLQHPQQGSREGAERARRRLVRAGGSSPGSGDAQAAAAAGSTEFVDLLSSQSPAQTSGRKGHAATAADEQQAWQALDSALTDERRQRASVRAR